ncbi:MAG: Holliday junction branch migration protein RuvA [Actinomycetota bacterium]|nr:Holliday junction branch migration protein RuvA [Acidimicrobiaceae bacterium]MCS5674818.1 Holliday junction branch migration protein RuvA [Acidimicrobiales bacterium]MED5542192.1 Holliday junction branch migration protein RuvA [Actinomycetota bacterium]MEE2806162.1 Holliday junction branch migration protein RuvA [Actinomycetota bacterium]|tara:strand:+ start:438 stop:1031 length:594 start_codon:yes stop_codon:yes gene_type:complete
MIGSLRGLLMDKDREGEVIVEVGGVGYRVSVNPGTLAELPEIGSDVFVHIHHHIREGDQQFYGFATLAERKCFESVIGAHGVGPALAMAVLATLPPDELGLAVATNDVDALCLVPGVGKKTAQRMVLELKNRLEISAFDNGELEVDNLSVSTALGDVRDALAQMGFGTDEVRRAVEGIEGDDTSIMLRAALQRLAAK